MDGNMASTFIPILVYIYLHWDIACVEYHILVKRGFVDGIQ